MADTAVKHTPGPWEFYPASKMHPPGSDHNYGRIVWACGRGEVAQTPGLYNDAEDDANARLIAAAPDLLEALCNVLSYVPHGDMPVTIYDNARAAIAKAEGKP
jgi:hypothetical protein